MSFYNVIIRTLEERLALAKANELTEMFFTLDVVDEIIESMKELQNDVWELQELNEHYEYKQKKIEEKLEAQRGKIIGIKSEQVVLCHDCRHFSECDIRHIAPESEVLGRCLITNKVHAPNWYCADGRKK